MLSNKDLFNRMFDSLVKNIKYLNDKLPNLNIYILIILNEYNEIKEKQITEILSHYNRDFAKIHLIKSRHNLGYAPSIYLAYHLTKNYIDYYVIMNDDIVIPYDHLIYSLLEHIKNDDKIVAISPVILNLNNPTKYDYAGAAGFYTDILLIPFASGRLNDIILRYKRNITFLNLDCDVFMPSGAFMLVKNIKETIPDPLLLITFEETDIGIRTLCNNYIICVDKSNFVYHKGSSTIGNINSPKRIYYVFRNRVLLIIKYSTLKYQIIFIPLIFLHDLIAALYLSSINKFLIISFIKAWVNIFRKYKFYLVTLDHSYRNCLPKLMKSNKIYKVPVNVHYMFLRIKYWRSWRNILQYL